MNDFSFWGFIKKETGLGKEEFRLMNEKQKRHFSDLLFRLFVVKFARDPKKMKLLEKL